MAGRFELKQAKDSQYMFNLKAGNGQTILSSEGYAQKASCLNGIASVKANSTDDNKYDRLTSSNGKPYFNLKAANGQVIGSSQMYESEVSRDNGIESVKANAPEATVNDETV